MKGILSGSTDHNVLGYWTLSLTKLKSDIWLLTLMITIGMLGCVYLIDTCKDQYIQDQTLFLDQNNNDLNHSLSLKKLSFAGVNIMGSPIVFNIPQDHDLSRLIIDYGDGYQDIVRDTKTHYAYDQAGVYQVKLIHVDQLKNTTIATTKVEIEENRVVW